MGPGRFKTDHVLDDHPRRLDVLDAIDQMQKGLSARIVRIVLISSPSVGRARGAHPPQVRSLLFQPFRWNRLQLA